LNSTPKRESSNMFDTSKHKFYSSMTDFNKKMEYDTSFTPKAICPDSILKLASSKVQLKEFKEFK